MIFNGIIILTAIQTNNSFNGLTMDTRGIPKEAAKSTALTRYRKFTSRVSLRKQTFIITHIINGVIKIGSLVSHENTRHFHSQTCLLACDTRQVLLEWDSSSINETMKTETKWPLGLGWWEGGNKLTWKLALWDKENAACHFMSQNPSLFCWLPDTSWYLHLLAGRDQRRVFLNWPKSQTLLLRQRTR